MIKTRNAILGLFNYRPYATTAVAQGLPTYSRSLRLTKSR
jgi:hypothetical protein